MTGSVENYEEKCRTAGHDTGKVNERVEGLVDALRQVMAVGPEAWGNDKFGSGFADGPEGFKVSLTNMEIGTANMASSWKAMSDGQYRTADVMAGHEDASTEGFRQI